MASLRQLDVPAGAWQRGEISEANPDNGRMSGHWSDVSHAETDNRLALLERTIEGEIIPRLMLAHRLSPTPTFAARDEAEPSFNDVSEFAVMVMKHEVAVAIDFVDAMRARGVPLEKVFLELLAPAARLLGDWWKRDVCDFSYVTVGLSRLHQILREYGPDFENETQDCDQGLRALLVPAPVEQQSLGLVMVDLVMTEEFFRRAGWDVWAGPPESTDELIKLTSKEWFTLVGFWDSCDGLIDELASCIGAMRKASMNPSIIVMVGGREFMERPELAARVGADVTACDGRDAVQQARGLLMPRDRPI